MYGARDRARLARPVLDSRSFSRHGINELAQKVGNARGAGRAVGRGLFI